MKYYNLPRYHSLPAALILLSGGEEKIRHVPLQDLPEFQVSARCLALGGFRHFFARLPFFEHFEFDLGVQKLVPKSAPLADRWSICKVESLRMLTRRTQDAALKLVNARHCDFVITLEVSC